jgi:hypothetical protein
MFNFGAPATVVIVLVVLVVIALVALVIRALLRAGSR